MMHKNKCPWPKGSECEALWHCSECIEWYYKQPWYWQLWDKMTHTFSKSWKKVQW